MAISSYSELAKNRWGVKPRSIFLKICLLHTPPFLLTLTFPPGMNHAAISCLPASHHLNDAFYTRLSFTKMDLHTSSYYLHDIPELCAHCNVFRDALPPGSCSPSSLLFCRCLLASNPSFLVPPDHPHPLPSVPCNEACAPESLRTLTDRDDATAKRSDICPRRRFSRKRYHRGSGTPVGLVSDHNRVLRCFRPIRGRIESGEAPRALGVCTMLYPRVV